MLTGGNPPDQMYATRNLDANSETVGLLGGTAMDLLVVLALI